MKSQSSASDSAGSESYAYIKFYGPFADDGRIDIAKAAKTMLALDRWAKRYKKQFLKPQDDFVLRAGAIEPHCTEIQLFADLAKDLVTPTSVAIIGGTLFRNFGVREFFNKFMGTLGEQLALKLLAKGQPLTEQSRQAKEGKVYVKVKSADGRIKEITAEDWAVYEATHQQLNGICNLEEGKEESLKFGYHDSDQAKDVDAATLTFRDKEAFQDANDPDQLARRMGEPFEEDKAEEVKIVGKFIDFYGLAHRYHFSFQARKEQDVYGKQKILCIIDKEEISKVIDLLKPEAKTNVCIKGKATKDKEGKIDKIKIEWLNTNPEFNPDQTTII